MLLPSSKSVAALISITIISLIACQKEIKSDLVQNDLSNSILNSNMGNENNLRKERKVLFVNNRDGNDEVYAMNADGSNIVRLTFNIVPDGRAT
jgi:hypothetical protein